MRVQEGMGKDRRGREGPGGDGKGQEGRGGAGRRTQKIPGPTDSM